MNDTYRSYSPSHLHSAWACLVGQPFRLSDPIFRREAMQLATVMMDRAKHHLNWILEQLHRDNYRFVEPHSCLRPPPADVSDWLDDLEERGIFLPLSVRAWLEQVGCVDLRGNHPDWPKPGFVFADMAPTNDVYYADPLVVQVDPSLVDYAYREWQRADSDVQPIEENTPFLLAVSPDHIHKANVSGGPPYEIPVTVPSVDTLLLNERHCLSFTAYVRIALRYGGFPGIGYLDYLSTIKDKSLVF